MIAVALGLIGAVVMITTGVAVSSSGDDHLAFLGIGVDTTTAQVFLTGAIFAWLFVIALWLLRFGMQRSNARCAQLAGRRARRVAAGRSAGLGRWLGFGPADESAETAFANADAYPPMTCFGVPGGGAGDPDPGGPHFGVGGTGAAGDDGAPPRRADGGPDLTHLSVAAAGDQAGPVSLGDPSGPGARLVDAGGGVAAGGFLGIGVHCGGQSREISR